MKKEAVTGPRVVGKVQMLPLASVKANSWNMNGMTDFQKESLKQGLAKDGWMASQALLIWGTDTKGKAKNIIIDGEHRWIAASELGMKTGPMVVLEGVSEIDAKALTIKMNHKRGESDPERLALVVKELQAKYGGDMAMELGIVEEELVVLTAEPEIVIAPLDDAAIEAASPHGPSELPSGKTSHVKMVQLFFDETQHGEFMAIVEARAEKLKLKNVTDVVMEALKRVSRNNS